MTSLIGTGPNQVSLNGMLGNAAFKDSDVPFYGAVKSLQSAPTIASATTIAPTALVTFISGTTSIATITPPANILTSGGMIILIPTGLWATTTAGNISIVTTATVGESIVLTYDAVTTKWYPAVGSALGSLTSAQLATALTDETGTGVNVFATSPTLVTPLLGTPTSGVLTNCTGTAAGLTAGNVTTNANLTGEVTSVGNATTVTNASVIGKVLTGYVSGAGTVAATDTILQAVNKLNGNDALTLPLAGGSMTGSITIPTGQKITLTNAPVAGTDAVNKTYVDALVTGLSWKNSVKVATTADITLSATQTIDGILLIAGDRVLVKDQTTSSQNGIYLVAAGAWTRSLDMDSTTPINEVNSAAVFVEQGTLSLDTGWTQINQVVTLGTDAISFTKFTGTTANLTGAITSSGTVTSLGSFTSAQLATALTDETGTGSAVFATAPTFPTTITVTGNATVNNVIEGYATTATAATTTTLTSSSTYSQFFSGTTTQTVLLPNVTTLALGHQFNIVNNSTGAVSVQSSGANVITALAANTSVIVTCIAITGTTNTSWSASVTGASGGGSVTISDDTTTAATYYPTFLTATTGTASAIKTSSTRLTYTPSTGTLYATIFNSSSDERLKDNIVDLPNGLEIINKLSPKSFNWKSTGIESYGVIAQELELIVPNLVSTSNDDGYKSVNYDAIIAFLISAVKELSAKIDQK